MRKFYDTCSLLNLQEKIFESDFLISNITLSELENIKTSSAKDEEIKYKARKLTSLLLKNKNKYETILYNTKIMDKIIDDFCLIQNNDSRIIISAYYYYNTIDKDIIFITDDLCCGSISQVLGIPTDFSKKDNFLEENYKGYKEIIFSEKSLAEFYEKVLPQNLNIFQLEENEYLLLKEESTKKIIDKYKWKEQKYQIIPCYEVNSQMFGKITPMKGDPYQHIAIDSLFNNQMTMLTGDPGTGKTLLSFAYMFYLLEKNEIDRIIIFCNTVATKGSAKLGFYPGDRTSKLLDSQIGNLLQSKFGDRIAVERLIEDGKLILLPMSDIRGYDTSGMNCAVYLSEAQNLDIELMKLALQRIGEDSICIIDGDYDTQLDLSIYEGNKNGMRRVSQVFKGQPFYGKVKLQNIYRSKIAKIAEQM